jgi:NAD(P)-dependent dehydrogenase (short-subunit alcohol dehydrogenase family)
MARALAAAGASVAVSARSRNEIEAVAGRISKAGGRAEAIPVDVTDEQAVATMVTEAESRLGPPTLLVANAGRWRQVGPLAESDAGEWWRDVEVSLRGTFLTARAVIPGMVGRGLGRIVIVSSYAGIEARPFSTAYASAKAALLRLTDSLEAELTGSGVHAFAITPGFVRTELIESVAASEAAHRYLPGLARRDDALGPEEAARLVVDIASGRLDRLAGRFLHVLDDVDDLLRRIDEVTVDDLYTLRLRRS